MSGFTKPLKYSPIKGKWFVLDEDVAFYFTLREILYAKPTFSSQTDVSSVLDELVELTGLDPDAKIYVTAPKGFITDLASVPKIFHWLIKPSGKWTKAAIIHDLLYGLVRDRYLPQPNDSELNNLNRHYCKFMADRIFYVAMQVLGVKSWIRNVMYEGVCIGGGPTFYNNYPSPVIVADGTRLRHYHLMDMCYKPFSYEQVSSDCGEVVPAADPDVYGGRSIRFRNLKRPLLFLN